MKKMGRKLLSYVLTAVMILGMLPGITPSAQAATNLAGGFEGQDADVFTALGFDTTQVPEGYNEDDTENPYGRDIVPGNQVFELATVSAAGVNVYGKDGNIDLTKVTAMPSGAAMPGDMKLFAAAAGDFDGDGLPGGIACVGIAGTSGGQKLYLCLYDAEQGSYGAAMEIGSGITPEHTCPGGYAIQEKFDFAWQNLLQITAGDYDGDGTAEIAVYVAENAAARVDIYKYQKTSQSGSKDWLQAGNWSRVWSHALSADVVPNMVSLESGDFNRDGVDDLAVASGSLVFNPYTKAVGDETNLYMSKQDGLQTIYSRASTATVLWGARSRMLQTHDGLDLNSAELGEQVRVGLAYGDVDGDDVKELIAAGQPSHDAASNTSRTITTYAYVSDTGLTVNSSGVYKVVDGSYVTVEVEGQEPTTNWKTNNGFDDVYHSLPFMAVNAAVMRPADSDYTYLYVDSCLYQNTEGNLQLTYSLDDESYSVEDTAARLDAEWGVDKAVSDGWDASYGYCEYGAVTGDVDGSGADILSTALISPQTNTTVYENQLNNKVLTLWGGGDGVTLDNAAAENSGSLHVSPVLVDADMDTVIIEYTGVHYLTYSDPQVLAIIAAAPYFEDVDEVVDYDYAWQNTTSFSRIQGEGQSEFVTFDLEVGGWADSDWVIGGGKMVLEAAAMFTLEWEESTTRTVEYELTFETSQDEDAVAFYSIPTENYVYNVYVPNGEGGYDVEVETIQNTFTPCYQILNLDYYESIQGNYDELPQISGVALTSTPGDPASYPSSTSGYNVIAQWNDDPAGVSFGNGSISQTITITEEQSESYNMGAAVDFKVGGGSGAQSDIGQAKVEVAGGVQGSINPAGGWADINFTGTSFSGTVTNMPLEFQDYGYYYSWRLFAYNYVFDNGASIPVVSYVVGDVSAPPELPEDFQQDYDRTTDEENVLTWTYDGAATKFYLYKYYDFPVGGGLDLIAEIDPADSRYFEFKQDGDGKTYKQYCYTDANLTPYTEYQYAIQVERLDRVPPLSSPSGLLTARTRAAEGYPLLYISESDNIHDGTLLVYPDKNSYLTVDVKGPQGENAANHYSIVQYQWQKMEKGAWVDMVNETGMTLTFANAGVDTAGSYRCRVNVQVRDTAAYITAYTGTVVLTHAKRTSYIDETTLRAEDVTGGGIQLYAQVKNAHSDSAAIPSGTVTFLFTSTATGESYTFFAELDATGAAAKVVEGALPAGMYTVAARYAGSYIFKACSAECMYLSQLSSGYTIDLPASVTYGDGAALTFYEVSKSGGVTTNTEQKAATATLRAADATSTVYRAYYADWGDERVFPSGQRVSGLTAGTTYRYMLEDGIWRYFTATHSTDDTYKARLYEDYVIYEKNVSSYLTYTNEGGQYALAESTPAGAYLARMQGEADGPYTEALFSVDPRPVTLQLPDQKGTEGTDAVRPKLGELAVAEGSWADCDLNADGTLKAEIADTTANTTYYNTAWQEFDHTTVDAVCGYYTIRCADTLTNYDLRFLDGSLTILGATHDVTAAVRPFEGQRVGTLYAVSPDYASTRAAEDDQDALVQEHQTGTRLVFSAVPDAGYEIYDWYINGVAQNSKATSIAHVLLNEDTTIEVQFAVKQNTLAFGTAGDEGGGTLTCSDPSLTSGSVVIANSLFTFTAQANKGYHFKEWRYTQVGQGTQYDDEDFGKDSSTFELVMPSASCSVYAVFERDSYTFTYEDLSGSDGLTAWYENRVNDAPGAEVEKVYFESGASIKGDTVVTVEPASGCTWNADYRYVSSGSQGTADYDKGTYTVTVTEPTAVTGYTNREAYDVTLSFDVKTTMTPPEGAEILYSLNGQEYRFPYDEDAASMTIADVPGGAAVTAQIVYPEYYDLKGWTSAGTRVTATEEINRLAVLITSGGAVTAGQAYYYTDSGKTYYFTSPFTGTAEWAGTAVTVYAAGSAFTIAELAGEETITVHLKEKDTHTVTMADIFGSGIYSFELPAGAKSETDPESNTLVTVHEGESLTVLVTPNQGKTVTYWRTTPASTGEPITTRATSLRYTIPDIREDYQFKPIFSNTTYNTITWPTISESTVRLTLSPESGYLSSVVSGNDFAFTLSGGGLSLVDKVYANGNQFIADGNTVDDTTYSYRDDTERGVRVYTINNITANQVITVTLKEIGVTVNGEDISAITGTGWRYDPGAQVLTLSRPNLTVSGTNDTALVPNFSIVMDTAASSATFSDLGLSSGSGQVIQIRADDVTLTAADSNYLSTASGSSTLIDAGSNLTLRGAGTLSLFPNGGAAISAGGTLTAAGSVTVDVDGSSTGTAAITAGSLAVGQSTGSASPTLRVNVSNYTYGIQAGSVCVYSGELNVSGDQHAIYAGTLANHSGSMELSTKTGTPLGNSDDSALGQELWTAHYPNGYLLRAGASSSDCELVSQPARSYSASGKDVLATGRLPGFSGVNWVNSALSDDTRYVRLSPFNELTETTDIVLTVTYGGKSYSCTFEPSGKTTGYTYYIDTTQDSGKIRHLVVDMDGSKIIASDSEPAHLIPVAQQSSGNAALSVDLFAGTWTESAEGGWIPGDEENSGIQLSYTLSGAIDQEIHIFPNEEIDASSDTVQDLTLDNFTFRRLIVNDNPVYLVGDNTLNHESEAPLELGDGYETLNLWSRDGTGTLTLIASGEGDPALMAKNIDLHNVSALTAFVQEGVFPIQDPDNPPSSGAEFYNGDISVNYYDESAGTAQKLSYGLGWRQEGGTSAAASSVIFNGPDLTMARPYTKFCAATTEARVKVVLPNPDAFSYNKSTEEGTTQLDLVPPAVNGRIHRFDRMGGSNAASGSVALIDAQGAETKLASGTAYTATTSEETGETSLTLLADWLKDQAVGGYTIRVYFYDDDTTDATTYTLDIPLTITETAVSSGDLTISPTSATVKRGDSLTLTTAFTGTTPKVYVWEVSGGGTLSHTGGSTATLTVDANAAIDSKITVTVRSYADAEKNTPLGTATATVTVVSTAQGIDVTCVDETPSGDGSYTLYHNTPDGTAKTWDFDAAVNLDAGTYDPSKLTWSLWGAQRAATGVDASTGEVTISPSETGTNGQLQLTATYENADGSRLTKTVVLYLSTDAWVAYDNAVAAGGSLTGAVWGSSFSIPAGGDYIPAGSTVVVTAAPEDEFAVRTWYVNGESVMDNPRYTVDGENHTLTFTTAAMSRYMVTADYVNTNAFVITYSAGENGSLTAQRDGETLASGETVVKGSTVTFTATPDTYCAVAKWTVDGVVRTNADGTVYTGNTLTLSGIEAEHTVTVEFVGEEITIRFQAGEHGSVTLLVNGRKVENAASPYTVNAMDDVLLLATPAADYLVDTWSAGDGSGSYAPISGTEGSTAYAVNGITQGFDVKVSFKEVPSYQVTVTTNSFENGAGTVKSGTTEVPMSGSHTFTVPEHDTLTLLAVPDTGSYVYQWRVPDGVEYVENGNSITLLDVQSHLNDIEGGQYIGVTFRRSFYDVTLSTEGIGSLEADYTLTIGTDTFAGTITDSESIRGGSQVTLTVTPGTDYILSALTVNGDKVAPAWDEDTGSYTYTIDALTEDAEVEAVFIEASNRLTVTVPASFQSAGDPTVTEGTAQAGFVPDGSSADAPDSGDGTDGVLIAPGGTARLTFTPEDGYTVDYNRLAAEMDKVIPADSEGVYSLSIAAQACVVTITGVDTDLDFTDMASPFVTTAATTYHEVTIAPVTDGTLEVWLDGLSLQSGAQVPQGSELTIAATPAEHFKVASLTDGGNSLLDGTETGKVEMTLTVEADVDLAASFERSEYEVTVDILGSGSGTVTIDGEAYAPGTYPMDVGRVLTIAAQAEAGSRLNTLGVSGGTDNGDGTYSVTLSGSLTITAVFDAVECAVTFNDPENGTLTILDGSGSPVADGQLVPVGTILTILAVPDAHYQLDTLTAGGADYTSNFRSFASYTVHPEKRNHIQCIFAVAEVPVSWTSVNGTVTVTLADGTPLSNGQHVPVGAELIVKTSPATSDYSLKTFTVTGTALNNDGRGTVGEEPVVITAQFDFTGELPTGPEGPEGPEGPAGPEGPRGPSGSSGSSPDGEYTVEILVTGNGRLLVTAGGKEISSGDVVEAGTALTITAEPDAGEGLSALTVNGVAFTNGNKYEVYANTSIAADFGDMGQPYYLDAGGNRVFIGFAYDVDGNGTWSEEEYIAPDGVEVLFTPNPKAFDDVPGHWGEVFVSFVAERELLMGVTDRLFAPDDDISRALFATVVGRLYERSFGMEIDGKHDFDDCDYGAYYGRYVDWAAEMGIISGYGNRTFGPNDLITREQMAVMLYRFAVIMGVKPQTADTELTYADNSSISVWAQEGVLYCQSAGLMYGVDDKNFGPQHTVTRAQMATIIHNFIKTVLD